MAVEKRHFVERFRRLANVLVGERLDPHDVATSGLQHGADP
jgi:hypothetical protein